MEEQHVPVARMSGAFEAALTAAQQQVSAGQRVVGLALLATGHEEIVARFAEFERRTRASIWNMQVRAPFRPAGAPVDDLDERSRRRGVTMRFVTSPYAMKANPLLSSQRPRARRGPVSLPLLVIDGSVAVVAGPRSPSGEVTAWTLSGGELRDRAIDLWEATWAVSEPWVADGEEPPLTERQVRVARLMALGRTDAAILREVGVSRRTLTQDVAVIMDHLGAGSRFEAGLKLSSM